MRLPERKRRPARAYFQFFYLRGKDGSVTLLSSIIASQDEEHAKFGGVVPEIAARAHMKIVDEIIAQAVTEAGIDYTDLDGIAATAGPGLIGGVIAGLMAAKGLAMALNAPLIAVNHLEGHALSPRLAAPCPFPYLLLLVSGGHSQLLSVKSLGEYERLGSTVDDAAGEAFDKTAKVMGLGFPGGPNVERTAKSGNPKAFALVCDVLSSRTENAMDMFLGGLNAKDKSGQHRFVVAGGVASNSAIRETLTALCAARGFALIAPPLKFCTDNAAMIALAGAERLAAGESSALSVKAKPRWPLDSAAASANPMSGSGRKGAKS